VTSVIADGSALLRASVFLVFAADFARRGPSARLGFDTRLWPGLNSGGRVPQEATTGAALFQSTGNFNCDPLCVRIHTTLQAKASYIGSFTTQRDGPIKPIQ